MASDARRRVAATIQLEDLKAYPFDLRDQFAFISDLTGRGKTAIRRVGGVFVTAGYAESSGQ